MVVCKITAIIRYFSKHYVCLYYTFNVCIHDQSVCAHVRVCVRACVRVCVSVSVSVCVPDDILTVHTYIFYTEFLILLGCY